MIERHSPAARAVESAAINAAWDLMAEPLRIAARDHGYALALHGSLARDLDLIAVPWIEHGVDSPEALVASFCGVLRGLFGRANTLNDWAAKPHGRRAITIMVWGGWQIDIDLSVTPLATPPEQPTPAVPVADYEQKPARSVEDAEHLK